VIRIEKVDEIEGDATINIRRGKKIVYYDLKIEATWVGFTKDRTGATGKLYLPSVSQDCKNYEFESMDY
jgi:activator of HSP90 ATPase